MTQRSGQTARTACLSLVAFLLLAGYAWAQGTDQTPALTGWQVSPGQVWTFFFLLLGPIKIIAPFAAMTRGGDDNFLRQLALRSVAYAVAVLLVAVVVGVPMLRNFNMQPAVLVLAGGIIVFLVALRALLDQISGNPPAPPQPNPELSLRAAFSPLAFPVIVTPAGIAAVIVFMALAPDAGTKLVIISLMMLVMALDLCAMLFARFILRWAAMPLQVFGAVLGIIQLALGLHIILNALHNLTVINYHAH